MKTLSCASILWLAFFIMYASPASSQEAYTFIANSYGQQVCIGRWVPSSTGAQGGVCEGELIGLPQLTAVSARQSLERLEQVVTVLSSISDKMDVSNDQLSMLIQVTANAQQAAQNNEALRRAISQRFAALSLDLTENEAFREEIASLKKDILKEVEKRYPAAPAGAAQ
jgi:hypothetical protein